MIQLSHNRQSMQDWIKLVEHQLLAYKQIPSLNKIQLLVRNQLKTHLTQSRPVRKQANMQIKDKILYGGLISNLVSNALTAQRVSSATKSAVKDGFNELATTAAQSWQELIPQDLSSSLQTIGKYYNDIVEANGAMNALSGDPKILSSQLCCLHFNSLDGELTTEMEPELIALSGGFLSGLKKVANKVANVITKVADIPVIGTALQAIPGVGAITSAARTVANLTNSSDVSNSSVAAANTTQNTDANQQMIDRIQTAASATQAAETAINKADQTLENAQPTVINTAEAIDNAIPLDMETVNQARSARIKAAALKKNAAILGYALGGDPTTVSAAADLVLAASAIPQQSAIATGTKTQSKYGIWNPQDNALILADGVSSTDVTAALTIALDLASAYSPATTMDSRSIDPADGLPSLLPVIGAEYVAEAIPALTASGYLVQLQDLIDKVILVAPKSLAANIIAQTNNAELATPSMLANWILIPLVLRAKKEALTATPDELELYESFTALGSTVLQNATSTDLNAIRSLYPYALATIYNIVLLGSMWQDSGGSEAEALQAWLLTNQGAAALEAVKNAGSSQRAIELAKIPARYRSLVRDIVDKYDEEGETGVSKVLSSIGSYVSKTFDALF